MMAKKRTKAKPATETCTKHNDFGYIPPCEQHKWIRRDALEIANRWLASCATYTIVEFVGLLAEASVRDEEHRKAMERATLRGAKDCHSHA